MSEAPANRLDEIAGLLPTLIDEVEGLAKENGTQFVSLAKKARSNRRMLAWLTISVALDIALSVLLGVGYGLLDSGNDRINALTARLDAAQTTQRQDALCPLYTLILAGDTPKARAAAPNKAQFDHEVSVLRAGYNALQCAQAKTTAPSLGPTAKA